MTSHPAPVAQWKSTGLLIRRLRVRVAPGVLMNEFFNRSLHYDRDGNAITMQRWMELFTDEYKRVKETTLPDGKWVSTVWLGIDHNFMPAGPPLIFETMVFNLNQRSLESEDYGMERYATEMQAIEGHDYIVQKWLEKLAAKYKN